MPPRGLGARAALALLAALLTLSAAASPTAAPPPAPPPTGPPVLEWSALGFTADHHVGSAPAAHFGVRVRNAGGGELQASFFVTSNSARFFIARPRDLTLLPGQERMVDIRAPLYLLDKESRFRENATCTIQSNGGVQSFSLAPEAWPEPPLGLRVHQMTPGSHAWHAEPADSGARLRAGALSCGAALVMLWLLARAARAHAHAELRADRRRRKPRSSDDVADEEEAGLAAALAAAAAAAAAAPACDEVEDDDDALAAVRALQAREQAACAVASARAAQKAAALADWHAAAAAPGASGGGGNDWGDDAQEEAGTRRDGESGASGASSGAANAQASASAAGAPAAALCTVCLVRPRDTVVLPCRHVALCLPCARRLVDTSAAGAAPPHVAAVAPPPAPGVGACPICRGRMENYLQLFMP